MARIIINEADNTSAASGSSLANIVYVPGYSTWGPVNEPILCTNVQQLKDNFGSVYMFKKAEDKNKVQEGDYEKSYLYARQLLNAGMPVLYERLKGTSDFWKTTNNEGKCREELEVKWSTDAVEGETETTDYVAKVTIQAKYAGYFGENIYFKAEPYKSINEVLIRVHLSNPYSEKPEEIVEGSNVLYFSLDKESSSYYKQMNNNLIEIVKVELTKDGNTVDPTSIATTWRTITETAQVTAPQLTSTFRLKRALDQELNEITPADIRNSLIGDETEGIESCYTKLEDTMNYNIKFVTSGAYYGIHSDWEAGIASKLIQCAGNRTDTLALIDFSEDYTANELSSINVLDREGKWAKLNLSPPTSFGPADSGSFGAAFAPNVKVNDTLANQVMVMPASLAYLLAAANSFKFKPVWMPVAGVNRGIVRSIIEPTFKVTNSMMDAWQPKSGGKAINPIMNIRNYGYCIYGNRTLQTNGIGLVANSFLNIRVGSNDIKKVIREAANSLMFEVNDNALWIKFRGKVEPYLDRMVSGGGLRGYKVVRLETLEKGKVYGAVRVIPVEGVEEFEINFELEDNLTV